VLLGHNVRPPSYALAMSTNPAEPLIVEASSTLRRPGRALIGWLPADRGAIVLAGGRQEGALDGDLVAQANAARAVVAARPAGIDQEGMVDETHPSLPAVTQRLHQQPDTGPFWTEGWAVAVVDLERVCSLQQAVTSQQAEDRVKNIDPNDLVSIGDVTLPAPSQAPVRTQLDEYRHTWIVSSANPNLAIRGHYGGEVQPGIIGFGVLVGVNPSFLQVARHHGRFVLRDGYHRAYGLLARGITHAPAFVRDFGIAELGTAAGLFGTDVYLSDRPPLLPDFLDNDVAANVEVPAVQKTIVVQGLELTPLA
jgi:hypothetical protein